MNEHIRAADVARELMEDSTCTAPESPSDPRFDPPEPRARSKRWRPFPVEALSTAMRTFVVAVAQATDTNPAYAALAALVVAAGCIGNRVAVLLKHGWVEPSVLWGALVGRSGTTKSPVLQLVTRATVHLFKEQRGAFEAAMREYEADCERHRVEKKQWEAREKKGLHSDPPLPPEPPKEERLLVVDTTIERLAELLGSNPLGLLLVRDELSAWLGSFDRYRSGARTGDQAAWVSMFGAGPLVVDRKGDEKKTTFIERAAVSVLGSIQPGTLRRCFGQAEREAGLLARVLLAMPPDRPSRWTDAGLATEDSDGWLTLLAGLRALEPVYDDDEMPRPRLLPLAPDARTAFIAWHDRHVEALADTDDDDVRAAMSKLKGIGARLALVLALVEAVASEQPLTAIPLAAVERAITLADWFTGEAARVCALFAESDEDRGARELAEWIERRGGSLTPRDVARHLRRFGGSAAAAEAALQRLVGTGWGMWIDDPPGSAGGRPTRRFVLSAPRRADADETCPKPEEYGSFVGAGAGSAADTGVSGGAMPDRRADETPIESGVPGAIGAIPTGRADETSSAPEQHRGFVGVGTVGAPEDAPIAELPGCPEGADAPTKPADDVADTDDADAWEAET